MLPLRTEEDYPSFPQNVSKCEKMSADFGGQATFVTQLSSVFERKEANDNPILLKISEKLRNSDEHLVEKRPNLMA